MVIESKVLRLQQHLFDNLGCVIIGRNEGKRLEMALNSIPDNLINRCVYVDSGSTDGSQSLAEKKGLTVIQLDTDKPFTAARARNAGAHKLVNLYPKISYIQFFDGDCSLADGWLETAVNFLNQNSDVAIVCGRRKERYPEKSIYNWLCDIEWDAPIGQTDTCGGDFCIRTNAFYAVDGFNPDLIAGEEPDLCYRLRMVGHTIYRMDKIMTWHDANIKSFIQWAKRTKRGGYAYAEAVYRHFRKNTGYREHEMFRSLFWGLILPVIILIASTLNYHLISLILIYPLHTIRVAINSKTKQRKLAYAFFMTLSKFPESLGILTFYYRLLFKLNSSLIEYK